MTDAVRAMPALLDAYRAVRTHTQALAAPLSPEDCQAQSMPDASPVKWHLAHTAWFFETFLLKPHLPGYRTPDPAYQVLFNSYYEAVGDKHPRTERGLVTRPGLTDVLAYRAHVDAEMERLLAIGDAPADLVTLGLNHEQQHQELVLMDVQHLLSCNPLDPVYSADAPSPSVAPEPAEWHAYPAGLRMAGHAGDGFAFDNEGPRYRVWLDAFEVSDRLVTNGEYLRFIEDDGYARPEHWLADGWATVQTRGWKAPGYWRREDHGWTAFGLRGRTAVDPLAPVLHLSHYEADAYARWAGCRLPTEAEWEVAATDGGLRQLNDAAWQWTASPYTPYPGFRTAPGAVGEYNGKFMANQQVLRGGCFATPLGHSRLTYRNFYPPHARWMFGGLRLAR